jgi:allantoate deiminase
MNETLTSLDSITAEANSSVTNELAGRALDYCEQLALLTQTPGQVDRRYLTKEHQQANQTLVEWASEYQLSSWQDAAGNQWLRLPSANTNAKRLIIGSHTDSVPNAGKYDGVLGVVLGLVILQQLSKQKSQFDYHIDVVGFGDEEGTRFGCTLLGSSAIAGKWNPAWRELTDADGVSLAQAMHEFGLDASKVSRAHIDSNEVLGYVELHIEQGPVLDEKDLSLAAVSSIAGARRFDIEIHGHAGHAGTVPMALRSDALVCASRWVESVYQRAMQTAHSDHPVVATVGKMQVMPGGVNVIPGSVALSLDIRSSSDAARDAVIEALQQDLEQLCSAMPNGRLKWLQTHNASAVACDQLMKKRVLSIMEQLGESSTCLVSGAGHDAMILADRMPVSMIFMRCKGGVSHHPAESVTHHDTMKAVQSLLLLVESYAHQ